MAEKAQEAWKIKSPGAGFRRDPGDRERHGDAGVPDDGGAAKGFRLAEGRRDLGLWLGPGSALGGDQEASDRPSDAGFLDSGWAWARGARKASVSITAPTRRVPAMMQL